MEAFWMVLISCVIGTVISSVISCLPGLHIYNVMGAMVLGLIALEAGGTVVPPKYSFR